MPAPLVSPWLFNAQALAAPTGWPHLQPGNHLRITHSPFLGLPDAPFLVWRAQSETMKGIAERRDAVWLDASGHPLTPPLTVTPTNPVTVRLVLGAGETCLWAEVLAEPGGRPGGDERPGGVIQPRPIPIPPRRPIDPRRLPRPGRSIGVIRAARGSGLRVEAFVTSPLGPAFSAARDEPRFAFAAPGIVELQISGRGTVRGILWMEAADMRRLQFEPWRALNLPHDGGARYISVADPQNVARDRVREAAPLRRPLQETLGTTAPAAAPAHSPAEEETRVLSLADPIGDDLDALINDLSQDERLLGTAETLLDENGHAVGTMTGNRLNRVLQAALDPGVAEYLGYMTVDRGFVEVEERFVFYLIDGYFQHAPRSTRELFGAGPAERAFEALVSRVPEGVRVVEADQVVGQLVRDLGSVREIRINRDRLREYAARGPFLRLGCLAVADRGAPPLPPPAAVIESHQHVGWLPALPPDARREVRLDVAQGLVAGLLAAERAEQPGGTPQSLNSTNGDGIHLPLALSLEADDGGEARDPEPGQGFLSDRQASAATQRYSIAQQDRFGRWSGWVSADNPAGPRPRPPRPVFQAFYQMPAIATPMPAGTVRIKVQVPRRDALAPGAHLLQRFRLEVQDLTTLATSTPSHTLPDPATPPGELDFTFPAPDLTPTEMRRLRLIARWEDVAGTLSVASEAVVLALHDPRPPEQLAVPDTLAYSARPDVQGRALVEYRWSPLPGQDRVAVYYSDENRLTTLLQSEAASNPAAQAALDALSAAADPAARATVFRSNAGLFKSFLFERLDLEAESLPGGEYRFQHYVSGSLRTLSFYRLSAESASRARVPLETLPLIVFGVPNSDPPAKPVLAVRPDPATTTGLAALAEVRVVPGVTRPVRLRLRRSVQSGNDPAGMPVVGEAPLDPTVREGFLLGSLVDTGPLQIAPTAALRPWVRYFWTAEVQGGPEPGSTVSGRWSLPADPVSLAFPPPGPPAPVTVAEALGSLVAPDVFEDVVLRFDHPESLNGGEFGSYRLRVYRQRPDEPQRALGDRPLAGGGPFTVSGMDPANVADQVPAGTQWRLVLLDPLDRASPPVQVTGVSAT